MALSIFREIAEAKTSQGGAYIQDGSYLLEVVKVKGHVGYKGESFIAEFKVLEASKVNDKDPNPVGSTCSMVQNFKNNPKVAGSVVRAFILALFGENDSEVTMEEVAKTAEELCSDAQPGKGLKIRLETFRKESQKGSSYIGYKWTNVPGQSID